PLEYDSALDLWTVCIRTLALAISELVAHIGRQIAEARLHERNFRRELHPSAQVLHEAEPHHRLALVQRAECDAQSRGFQQVWKRARTERCPVLACLEEEVRLSRRVIHPHKANTNRWSAAANGR